VATWLSADLIAVFLTFADRLNRIRRELKNRHDPTLRCEMLGLGEMKLVDGQDYSELIVVTLLYFMLVRTPISYHHLPPLITMTACCAGCALRQRRARAALAGCAAACCCVLASPEFEAGQPMSVACVCRASC
jgi:hypothetical protein